MKKKKYYMPNIMKPWSDITATDETIGIVCTNVKIADDFGKFFIPVFETKKECKKHYPKDGIQTIIA